MADRSAFHRSVLLVLALTLAAGSGWTSVGPVGQQATPVDTCTTIDEPGEYVLTADIADNKGTRLSQSCFLVTADDVVLDGQGHLVDGRGISDSTGVTVEGASRVTVLNLRLSDWNRGLHYRDVVGGTVRGVVAKRNARGIDLDGSSDVVLADNQVARNLIGVDLARENRNVSLDGNVVRGNFYADVNDPGGNATDAG